MDTPPAKEGGGAQKTPRADSTSGKSPEDKTNPQYQPEQQNFFPPQHFSGPSSPTQGWGNNWRGQRGKGKGYGSGKGQFGAGNGAKGAYGGRGKGGGVWNNQYPKSGDFQKGNSGPAYFGKGGKGHPTNSHVPLQAPPTIV